MRRLARRAAAVAVPAATFALALGGCGFGAGDSSDGGARLDLTRDFGTVRGESHTVVHVQESDTVMRFIEKTHEVKTRYGGDFVQSVDGVTGDRDKRVDWFYYVNGFEADVGASDFSLSDGDRVQWDFHSWAATMRVPGIVGAFPEPFLHGYGGKRLPVRLECAEPEAPACKGAADRLERAGVVVTSAELGVPGDKSVAHVVVGKWSAIKRLQAAAPLARAPSESGVFARFAGLGAGSLQLLKPDGSVARVAPPKTGIVAARVPEEHDVVWFVTGLDATGVERAARALDEDTLRDAFAVAATPSGIVRLPVGGPK
jgi:Domain of unknown function (DUF4430)